MSMIYGMTIIEWMILVSLLCILYAAICLEVDSKKVEREEKRVWELRKRLYGLQHTITKEAITRKTITRRVVALPRIEKLHVDTGKSVFDHPAERVLFQQAAREFAFDIDSWEQYRSGRPIPSL